MILYTLYTRWLLPFLLCDINLRCFYFFVMIFGFWVGKWLHQVIQFAYYFLFWFDTIVIFYTFVICKTTWINQCARSNQPKYVWIIQTITTKLLLLSSTPLPLSLIMGFVITYTSLFFIIISVFIKHN